MKKILAIVLMTAVLVCPAFASGEPQAQPAAEPAVAAATEQAPHYVLQVIEPATCTENGISAYVDANSGETLFTFETAATGHTPSADHATCTDAVVCTVCGEELEPATGHNYTYQFDADRNADGTFNSFGTWKCDNCGDVVAATEGNAIYYYGAAEAAPAPAGDASAEPAGEASAEPSAEAAPAEEAAVPEISNPNYDPNGHNWASIEITLALIIVVVGAILMLSFGKKKVG